MNIFRQSTRPEAVFSLLREKGRMILPVVFIVLIGLGLRLYAAPRLPIDSDERVYLRAALQYASFLREGQWRAITWYDFNTEHPLFYKLAYSAALLSQPPLDQLWTKDIIDGESMGAVPAKPWGMTGRYLSVAFGTLAVLTLAAVNPLAGLFLAVDTLAIQYTSTMFLEALPILASSLAAACYLRWRRQHATETIAAPRRWAWLGLSAAFLGIAAASKYTYGVVGLAVVLDFASDLAARRMRGRDLGFLAAWGAAALLVFYLANPYLWTRHPLERLSGSLLYHQRYSGSDRVQDAGYPFYQPLAWFAAPFRAYRPHAASSFILEADVLIGLLALAGLPRLYARQRFYFFWLLAGLGTLMLWPTKWPQYTMIVIVPLCFSAALGANWLHDLLKAWANQPHKHTETVRADLAPAQAPSRQKSGRRTRTGKKRGLPGRL